MLDYMTAWLGSAFVTFITHRDLTPCVHDDKEPPLSGISLANVCYTVFILANITSLWTILKAAFFRMGGCMGLDTSRVSEYKQSAAIVAFLVGLLSGKVSLEIWHKIRESAHSAIFNEQAVNLRWSGRLSKWAMNTFCSSSATNCRKFWAQTPLLVATLVSLGILFFAFMEYCNSGGDPFVPCLDSNGPCCNSTPLPLPPPPKPTDEDDEEEPEPTPDSKPTRSNPEPKQPEPEPVPTEPAEPDNPGDCGCDEDDFIPPTPPPRDPNKKKKAYVRQCDRRNAIKKECEKLQDACSVIENPQILCGEVAPYKSNGKRNTRSSKRFVVLVEGDGDGNKSTKKKRTVDISELTNNSTKRVLRSGTKISGPPAKKLRPSTSTQVKNNKKRTKKDTGDSDSDNNPSPKKRPTTRSQKQKRSEHDSFDCDC